MRCDRWRAARDINLAARHAIADRTYRIRECDREIEDATQCRCVTRVTATQSTLRSTVLL